MLLDALYTTLNPIVPAFPIVGDEIEANIPFLVFQTTPEPLRTKDGILGYNQSVRVSLVDVDLDRLDSNVEAVKTALESMSGTIGGTIIEDVLLQEESGAYFNDEVRCHQYDLQYRIDTGNR